MISVTTKNVKTSKEQGLIDQMVNIETVRKTRKVKGSKSYGIMTACMIDGEFVLVTEYDLPEGMAKDLENA